MEKFYTINQDTDLYIEYFQYWNDAITLNKVVKSFSEDYGIESKKYYANSTCLYIVPTENDRAKFSKQLSAETKNNGLKVFKQNSEIGKAWKLKMNGFEPTWKPIVQFYFGGGAGARYRLFHINDVLYCSFEAPYEFKNPEGFTEILGSEFHKIMEQLT